MCQRVAVVVLVLTGSGVRAADPAVIDLGGIRQAKATVGRDAGAWVVTVRMVPVRCFSPAVNDALNRDKARAFGLQALAKHLLADHPAGVTLRGVRVDSAKADGDAYALTLRVPGDGIVAAPKGPRATGGKGQPAGERAAFASGLFTRKGEYTQTLATLDRFLADGLAESERATKHDGGVEKLGADGASAFKTLGGEIEADGLLLTVEKEELLASVRERADAWKAQLERATRFAGVEIEPAFRPYLTANLLLMETAGAKVVDLKDGRRVVLAVASTAVKDGSADDRLRAERVCRVKALAAVVAERDGVQVARTEESTDRTVVVVDKSGEKVSSVSDYLQLTTAQVQGVAKDMPVVGRWRSRDGSVCYLALGVIVDKGGRPAR